MHSIELGRDPKVKSIAKLVASVRSPPAPQATLASQVSVAGMHDRQPSLPAQINYSNKNVLSAAMIVAGWDAEGGGQVFGVPISGTLVREPWTTDGSGSTYLWGYLDSVYRSAPLLATSAPCSLEGVPHGTAMACTGRPVLPAM